MKILSLLCLIAAAIMVKSFPNSNYPTWCIMFGFWFVVCSGLFLIIDIGFSHYRIEEEK